MKRTRKMHSTQTALAEALRQISESWKQEYLQLRAQLDPTGFAEPARVYADPTQRHLRSEMALALRNACRYHAMAVQLHRKEN